MKKLGLLERDHGGAVVLDVSNEISISVRQQQNTQEKIQTAQIALSKIPPFKSIFIDNSSTAFITAMQMDFRHKTVVTNGIALATELAKREEITVIMPCGIMQNSTNSIIGAQTLEFLQDMHFSLYIGSCAAISKDGSYENSSDQSAIKKLAIYRSTNKILLADQSKFSQTAMYKSGNLADYNAIFTNASAQQIAAYKMLPGVNIFNK
jgi:DeoR/GlpR family transcriptional regulator of sugar metabolism